MKAAVLEEKNLLSIKEVSTPSLDGKGAIIKVLGCGLCGSDIVKIKSNTPKLGAIFGHEIVGVITEIESETDFNIGDKVCLGHHIPCMKCQYCLGESYSMCKTFKKTNIKPGGFAQHIKISEAHLKNTVCKIPKNMPAITASFTEPLACCIRAIKRARIKKGNKVLVVGLGSIGLLMGQVAKHYGAKVIGCDILQERITLAKNLRFDETALYQSNESSSQIIKKKMDTEAGIDKIILTAGNDSSIPFALNCVRDGGTIIIFASTKSNDKGFTNNDIYYRELEIKGSYSPSPEDIKEAFALLQEDKIKIDNLTTTYPLNKINEAVADFSSNKILKAYIKVGEQ